MVPESKETLKRDVLSGGLVETPMHIMVSECDFVSSQRKHSSGWLPPGG
jgi:hypothetical protein